MWVRSGSILFIELGKICDDMAATLEAVRIIMLCIELGENIMMQLNFEFMNVTRMCYAVMVKAVHLVWEVLHDQVLANEANKLHNRLSKLEENPHENARKPTMSPMTPFKLQKPASRQNVGIFTRSQMEETLLWRSWKRAYATWKVYFSMLLCGDGCLNSDFLFVWKIFLCWRSSTQLVLISFERWGSTRRRLVMTLLAPWKVYITWYRVEVERKDVDFFPSQIWAAHSTLTCFVCSKGCSFS